jgi:hypothetical protein
MTGDYYIILILFFLVSIPFFIRPFEKWEAITDEKKRQKKMEERKERENLEEGQNPAL